MIRSKTIKKIGDSAGVIFNREERKMFNINVGDIVEVTVKKVLDK
jgi:antitoxin component of MazEF toxin-antitoxin module